VKDTLDEVTKLQTLIELYKPKAVTEFQMALVRNLERIIGKISMMPTDFSRSRLNALKKEIADIIVKGYSPFIDNLLDDNLEMVNMAYSVYAGALSDDFVSIPQSAVKRILDPKRNLLGQTLNEVSDGLRAKQVTDYKRIISDGLIRGSGVAPIAKELRAYNDGTLRNHINSIVNTSMQSSMQEAYVEAAKQSDSVISYAFSSGVLDSRTSPICQEQLGKSVKRGEDEPFSTFRDRALKKLIATPRHVNCRSKIIFESAEAFAERSDDVKPAIVDSDTKTVKHRDGTTSTKNINKQVDFYPQDITYDTFFNKQSAKFQRSVLGAKKYDLFKQGKLKVSEIRDIRSNRFLSNNEIMELI